MRKMTAVITTVTTYKELGILKLSLPSITIHIIIMIITIRP